MTSRNRFASVSLVLPTLATAAAGDGSPHVSVVRGGPNSIPPGYVPPLVSNGSLCLLVDYQGGQSQRAYLGMTPGIWWAGRRYVAATSLKDGHCRVEVRFKGETDVLSEKREDGK